MSKLYLIYLFIVETIPCERIFSKSGLIVSKNRAALSPVNVNKLVCLKNWLGL